MTEHREQMNVPYAPDQIYELVSDVRDYPNFIKWIKAMRVFGEHALGDGGVTELKAEAIVGYKFVRERFATKVTLNPAELAIDVSFISGPFSTLENRWRLATSEDGGTVVDFFIEFEFKNRILQALFDANFDRATNKLMDAFEQRAHERFAGGQTRRVGAVAVGGFGRGMGPGPAE